MKKIFSLIFVLGLSWGDVIVSAELKWPNYLTKEIPLQILNKFGKPSEFYNDIKKLQTQNNIDLNNPKTQFEIVKVMVQTLNANMMMGNLDYDNI